MSDSLRFGRIEVSPRERQLRVDGVVASVGARAFDLLLALIERRNRLVTKSELLELVWPGLVVEENNLQVQISSLRKLLGPQVIATIPGRGYRFSAALNGEADGERGRCRARSRRRRGYGAGARLTNLPTELPLLYGRDDDLTALRALIEAHRLVTVVGAGGIGKSRLAQAAAHAPAGRWPDGAWMVELAGLADPALLPNIVAAGARHRTGGSGSALDELVAGMAPNCVLLVLDNCEHLLDAVVALVHGHRARCAERHDAVDQPGTAAPAGRAAIPADAAGRAVRRPTRPARASSAPWPCSRRACARWTRASRSTTRACRW